MKEKLLKMLNAKKEARAKAMEAMAAADDAELRAAQLELIKGLDVEIRGITDMLEEAEASAAPAAGNDGGDGSEGDGDGEQAARAAGLEDDEELTRRATMLPVGNLESVGRASVLESQQRELEQRGADLRAGKTITVRALPLKTTGGILIEEKYSRELAPTFNEVSTLIDSVNAVPLQGGESYSKAFAVSGGEGGYTAEGAAATDAEPTTDFVDIAKSKITAYTEITEEIKKLPNVDYVTYIQGEVRNAIRKKITKEIIAGAGTTNTLTGIYTAPTKVIPTASDLEVSAIDADTLNDIVFAYGGDEDVEDGAILVLSKADLRAFSNVKNGDDKRIYKIEKRGNTGTLSYADGGVGVDFIINSACNSLSATTTTVGKYTMVYGRPKA